MNPKCGRVLSLLFLTTFWFTGCASRKAYVIARLDPQFSTASFNKISLAQQNQPLPDEQELGRALIAELERLGLQIVPQDAAEYTLACGIENNWRTRKIIVHAVEAIEPGLVRSGGIITPMPYSPIYVSPGGWHGPYYHTAPFQMTRVVDEQIPAQGIRLRMYSRHSINAGRFQAVWDGYIDGGSKVTRRRQPILLKTLLGYFGKDYSGRVALLDPATE